jgi:hypothetical protein
MSICETKKSAFRLPLVLCWIATPGMIGAIVQVSPGAASQRCGFLERFGDCDRSCGGDGRQRRGVDAVSVTVNVT